MPILANQFKPDDNQQPQDMGAPAAQSGGVGISGTEAESAGSGVGSGAQGGVANASKKPTSSGRFQNLNAYLKANQNFNQGQGGLGGQINQNLTSQSNDLQKNFAQSQQDYQTRLNNARQRYDQNFVGQTLQNAGQVSDEDAKKFAQMRDANYQGPTELDPEGQLRAQAQNFTDLTGQTGTESGRFNLLRQMYNNPTYSSGQQNLDNLFLQAAPNQLAKLQNSRITANQLNANLGQNIASAAGQGQLAQQEAQATQAKTRGELGGAITGFGSSMDAAVQKALADRQAKFEQEQGQLGSDTLGSEEALKWGLLNKLGDTQGINLYNLDLNKYLQQSNIAPTAQTVAGAQDYNRIQGLGKLAGNALTPETSKVVDMFGNPQLAGSFAKESQYDFNKPEFLNDLAKQKELYEGKLEPYRGELANAKAVIGQAQGDAKGLADYFRQQNGGDLSPEMQKALGYSSKFQGLNDIDVLRKMQESGQGTGVWTPQGYNQQYNDYAPAKNYDLNQLLTNYDAATQRQGTYQGLLDQLLKSVDFSRKLKINDANQFAPGNIATPGAQDVHPDISALNNIYNRI